MDAKSIYRREQSRLWWTVQRRFYRLFHSAEVLVELSDPSFRNRDEALALAAETDALPIDNRILQFAKILVKERVMPGPEGGGDAIHVAAATVFGVDFLVTWNQLHLANRNKIPHLREICRRAGFVPPDITTPEGLWIIPGEVDPS